MAAASVINPAAFSFTSIAILDALKMFSGPIVELHISNIHRREEHYHHSYVSKIATAVIAGLGPDGYVVATRAIVEMIDRDQALVTVSRIRRRAAQGTQMALLGSAAMLLWFDIVPEQTSEHDDWHTREHFPERVGIPGFIRAQRWVASSPGSRYFVMYEVADIGVLSSAPYLERLNNPTPWTRRMMPQLQGHGPGLLRTGEQSRFRTWNVERDVAILRRSGHGGSFVQLVESRPDTGPHAAQGIYKRLHASI